MEAGGQVELSIYDNPGLSGNPLFTQINPGVNIDLSHMLYTGTLYIQAITQGMVDLKTWKATYFSDEKPTITFRAKAKANRILPNEIINRSYVTTSTPEIETSNNSGSYTLYTETTDLAITKTVDIASAAIGDELTYTITYENKGPKDAQNVIIIDNLPGGVTYLSSSPQLTTPSYGNGQRRLEYRTDSYASEISFELTDGGGNMLAQKTRSTYNTNNTTFVFTGQLTVDGPISLSRRDSYGDGDGSYNLYLDGVLILNGPAR
ncbi:hypothetical protein FACS1894176_06250 [Bacteroidia bacterium]|nr:hypothetical protein FACS1894176_06250 [Bacteroidia bacterium]